MNILGTALFSLLLAQILKVFTRRPFDFTRLIGSGGLPSSHASFVCTLTTLLGLKHGLDSDLFALAVVFSLIIIYDARGVRRAVGEQANVLNNIITHLNLRTIEQERDYLKRELKELVGHTPLEVLLGCFLGVLIGFLAWHIWDL